MWFSAYSLEGYGQTSQKQKVNKQMLNKYKPRVVQT